ncbi:CDP-glycerol glycerophosphotransferase family protein [Mesobacillus maritimus]|uniref:CDP-glycerol glycerophosphotransferase family protein n=1 Tax=Mesobacillus maritimus TaxID=1643336 RepID=UPI00384D809B
MAREFGIFLYLRFIALIFSFYRPFPVKRKVVMVVSFAENNLEIYKEMKKHSISYNTVFLTPKKEYPSFSKFNEATTLLFDIRYFFQFLRAMYHLSTAKVILVDNYYGFLASARFKKGVKCIQLWHANGAIKKFGLEDHSIHTRTKSAKMRFKKVYDKFDHVIVGSDAMGEIFKHAFGIDETRILKTGFPRTDVFLKEDEQEKAIEKVYTVYPELQTKKVLLYAPTYRDEELHSFELKLNLEALKMELGNDYVLVLRLHPAVINDIGLDNKLDGFVVNCSNYPNLNDLLFITDILITDYSSIPFEYSFFSKPMIFYPYDLSDYTKSRGLWENYEKLVPGPIVYSTEELISIIKEDDFDYARLVEFHLKWNQYSQGESSKNIVTFLTNYLEGKGKKIYSS